MPCLPLPLAFETSRHALARFVGEHTAIPVATMLTDISTRTGERVFVFGLERAFEESAS